MTSSWLLIIFVLHASLIQYACTTELKTPLSDGSTKDSPVMSRETAVNVLWDHGLSAEEIAVETKEIVRSINLWQDAINARDSTTVAGLYDPSALLYATFKTRLSTPAEILSYFDALCAKNNLTVSIDMEDVRIFASNVAINSGIYTFTYTNEANIDVHTPARFTFVYLRETSGPSVGQWKIIDHHSSQDPEKHQEKEGKKLKLVNKLLDLYNEL